MAKKILVASGKGGVGKSTIISLLGVELAKLKKKVIIIELNIGLRSLDVMLGVENKVLFDLGDILKKRCDIDKAILECSYQPNLKLILSPIDCLDLYNEDSLQKLLLYLDNQYDYILMDTPAGIGQNFINILHLIDESLIIVTQDLISIRDGQKISYLLSNFKIKNKKLIINKVRPKLLKYISFDLDYVIDNVGIQLIAVIPEDFNIMKSTLQGIPLLKNTLISKIFNCLARRIIGENISLIIK